MSSLVIVAVFSFLYVECGLQDLHVPVLSNVFSQIPTIPLRRSLFFFLSSILQLVFCYFLSHGFGHHYTTENEKFTLLYKKELNEGQR